MEEEAMMVTSRACSVYGCPIKIFPSVKDLERVLFAMDDEFLAVIKNLTKARTVWRRMSKILSREGARPVDFFFKYSCRPVVVALQCRDVVGYPLHGIGPG